MRSPPVSVLAVNPACRTGLVHKNLLKYLCIEIHQVTLQKQMILVRTSKTLHLTSTFRQSADLFHGVAVNDIDLRLLSGAAMAPG